MVPVSKHVYVVSDDNLFEGVEVDLWDWALCLNGLAQLASRCPQSDRGPLIAMTQYLLSSCRRFVAALEGDGPVEWTPMNEEAKTEYDRLVRSQVSALGVIRQHHRA